MGDDREEVALATHVLVEDLRAAGHASIIPTGMMIPNREGPGGRMTAAMEVNTGYVPAEPVTYETAPPRRARAERLDRPRRGITR